MTVHIGADGRREVDPGDLTAGDRRRLRRRGSRGRRRGKGTAATAVESDALQAKRAKDEQRAEALDSLRRSQPEVHGAAVAPWIGKRNWHSRRRAK